MGTEVGGSKRDERGPCTWISLACPRSPGARSPLWRPLLTDTSLHWDSKCWIEALRPNFSPSLGQRPWAVHNLRNRTRLTLFSTRFFRARRWVSLRWKERAPGTRLSAWRRHSGRCHFDDEELWSLGKGVGEIPSCPGPPSLLLSRVSPVPLTPVPLSRSDPDLLRKREGRRLPLPLHLRGSLLLRLHHGRPFRRHALVQHHRRLRHRPPVRLLPQRE